VPTAYQHLMRRLAEASRFIATEPGVRRLPTAARDQLREIGEASAHLQLAASISAVVILAQTRSLVADMMELAWTTWKRANSFRRWTEPSARFGLTGKLTSGRDSVPRSAPPAHPGQQGRSRTPPERPFSGEVTIRRRCAGVCTGGAVLRHRGRRSHFRRTRSCPSRRHRLGRPHSQAQNRSLSRCRRPSIGRRGQSNSAGLP
jgi:hypothetical protein